MRTTENKAAQHSNLEILDLTTRRLLLDALGNTVGINYKALKEISTTPKNTT